MADLLPCPFCGSKNLERASDHVVRWEWIACHNCGARGPEVRVSQSHPLGHYATQDWNKRDKPEPLNLARDMQGTCFICNEKHPILTDCPQSAATPKEHEGPTPFRGRAGYTRREE